MEKIEGKITELDLEKRTFTFKFEQNINAASIQSLLVSQKNIALFIDES